MALNMVLGLVVIGELMFERQVFVALVMGKGMAMTMAVVIVERMKLEVDEKRQSVIGVLVKVIVVLIREM